MARMPVSVDVKYVVDGGAITATINLMDATGVKFDTRAVQWPNGVGIMGGLQLVRNAVVAALDAYLTVEDLPQQVVVSIGLDTTMRELDLL